MLRESRQEKGLRISILGGGIGGLSTAIALKLRGFDVAVYERRAQQTDIGAGIVCWPNATFVLDALGILERVRKVSGSLHYMHRFSDEGESIGTLDIQMLNRLMGYPSYSVIRKDLMSVLSLRATELNIAIHYCHEVTELLAEGERTLVKFTDGKQIQPDVIIGADGRMKSAARQYVNGSNFPVYQGFINWIGVFESQSPLFSELSVSDYWGVGERFGIVPVSATTAYWAGGVTAEKTVGRTPGRYKAELNAVFSHWPEIIPRIINGTPLSGINKIYVHDHDPIEVWHRNNVVLLGDAAHSPLQTSGQGACQALEDAWHLANCLATQTDNPAAAFAEFTRLRAPKTKDITMGGRQLAASVFNPDPEFCRQRNLASRNTDYHNAVAGMAKGWSGGLPLCR